MSPRTLAGWGITSIVVGSGFMLASTQLPTTDFAQDVPKWILKAGLWLGWILLIGGLFSAAAGWALGLNYRDLLPEKSTEFRNIKRRELIPLLKYANERLGVIPSVRVVKQNFKARPDAFYMAEKQTRFGENQISRCVGIFSLFPLNKTAVDALEAGKLDGLGLSPQHFARNLKTTEALYVGTIIGDGRRTRAELTAYLLSLVHQHARNGVGIVYTRPITHDGLRLAKRYGFEPVRDDVAEEELHQLYKRDFQDFNLPPEAEQILEPVHIAPNCPKCNRTMVQKTARMGVHAGKPFWGCSQFPRCNGLISIAADD